jgi:hypothetical protein
VPHRRRNFVDALSHRVGVEARRLSVLGSTLHQLRKALDRLTVEVLICVVMALGIWHLLSDTLWRLLSSIWR